MHKRKNEQKKSNWGKKIFCGIFWSQKKRKLFSIFTKNLKKMQKIFKHGAFLLIISETLIAIIDIDYILIIF